MPWTMRRTRNHPHLHPHRGETTQPEPAADTHARDKPPEAPPAPPSAGSRRSAKASPRLLFGRGPSGLWAGWVVVRVVWWWLSLLAVAGQCSPRRGDPVPAQSRTHQWARTGTSRHDPSRTGAPPVRSPATRPATARARLTERTVHATEQDASRTGTSRNEPGPQRTPAPNPPTRPPPAAPGLPPARTAHGPPRTAPPPAVAATAVPATTSPPRARPETPRANDPPRNDTEPTPQAAQRPPSPRSARSARRRARLPLIGLAGSPVGCG